MDLQRWETLEFPTWEFQWTFDLRTTRYCNTPKSQLEGITSQKTCWDVCWEFRNLPTWETWGNLGKSTPKQSQQRAFRDLEREINYDFISEVKRRPKKPNLPSMKISSKMKWNPIFLPTLLNASSSLPFKTWKKKLKPRNMGISSAMLPFRGCATDFTVVYKYDDQ